jgi:hypothetical protein
MFFYVVLLANIFCPEKVLLGVWLPILDLRLLKTRKAGFGEASK